MNQPKDLLSIGTFAEMSRLSIKALRLYDQLGILQPRHVDPQSGYRYYGVDQLSSARMIRNMRDMDMPLATIRRVLAVLPVSQAQVELLVRQYLEMRERQLEQIRGQARQFTQQLKPEANAMNLEVSVKDIPTQQIISITRHQKVDSLSETIQKDGTALLALVEKQGLTMTGSAFGIYHNPINEQEDGPIEICIPVSGTATGSGDIVVRQQEGGKAACVMITGDQCEFPAILGAYDAAADWIQKNGYQIAEPPREVWHTGPVENPKWEIVWLFR
ncbi:MAG: MerR family transcriptional regulator [Anaerolineae bacterium]|nr:MerR family transcriptional regulator [Anaerolineae bacterium]MCI0610845.1 MerR family transcriptional regulator [Anaerolineae bacterium]